MLSRALLIIGTLVGAGLSNPLSSPTGFCRTPNLSEEEKHDSRLKLANAKANAFYQFQESSVINVPTYFHVIASSRTEEGGYLKVSLLLLSFET